MSMSYELSCIVRWMAVGCVFGYDGSGCTSALGGHAEFERIDAGQLVRRTGCDEFLAARCRRADADADATGGGVFWVVATAHRSWGSGLG